MFVPEKMLMVKKSGGWSHGPKGTFNSYPVDKENKKTIQTARKWVKDYGGKGAGEDEVENLFNRAKIVDHTHRRDGGTIFKVVLNDTYYVDLRDRNLMDIIKGAGIGINGYIVDPVAFAVEGSQMCLMSTKTKKFKTALNDTKLAQKKPFKLSELQAGHLYKTKSGYKAMYMGRLRTLPNPFVTYEHQKEKKARVKHFFWETSAQDLFDAYYRKKLKLFKSPDINDDEIRWHLNTKTSTSYIIDLGKVNVKIDYKEIREELVKNFLNDSILRKNMTYNGRHYWKKGQPVQEADLYQLYFKFFPFAIDEDVCITKVLYNEMKRKLPGLDLTSLLQYVSN